jgi:iron(III) transport system substrate-binding protein
MIKRLSILLVLVMIFSGVALAEEPTLILYTSESLDLVNDMVDDFNEVYSDVNIDVFRSGTGPVVSKVQAEMESGEIQADMLWCADYAFFAQLAHKGLLLPLQSVEKDVSKDFGYDGGRFWEVRQIFNVVAYNTRRVKEAPTSWEDLLNEDYKGRIGMPSPLYSGAAFTGLSTLTNNDELGWEFYEGLQKNDVVVEQSNGTVSQKLASGEFVMANVIDFMVRNLKAEGSPVDYIWPKEGAVLVPTPFAIFRSTEYPEAANKFFNYMLSDRGQKYFAEQGYIPVRPNLGSPEATPDLNDLKVLYLDVDYMMENREMLKTRFGEMFQ